MASEKTKILARDNMLRRLQAHNVLTRGEQRPNRESRRAAIKRWCKEFGVPYADAMQMIKEQGPGLLEAEKNMDKSV